LQQGVVMDPGPVSISTFNFELLRFLLLTLNFENFLFQLAFSD